MSVRARRAELIAIAATVAFSAAVIPFAGPALFAFICLSTACFTLALRDLDRARYPEWWLVASFLVAELSLGAGIYLSGSDRMLLLILLALPALLAASVWPARGALLATVIAVGAIVSLGFLLNAATVEETPPFLIYPIATLIGLSLMAAAARGADVASRAAAHVDRLTGLLNRAALGAQAAELAHQGRFGAEETSLLLADLDHFKEVNDRFGHKKGDLVLRAVATRLRQALAGRGTLYRVGGEELVCLLPGFALAQGAAVAEELRQALVKEPLEGLSVTASFGVAGAPAGGFRLEEVLSAADSALYAAKRGGRNRAEVAAAGAARKRAERTFSEERRALPATASMPSPRAPRPATPAPVSATARTAERGGWIAFEEAQRAHMLDLIVRIKEVRLLAYGSAFLALVAGGPFYGFLPLLPPLLAAVVMGVVIEVAVRKSRRPELPIAAAVLFSQVANAQSLLLVHNHPYAALCLLPVLIFAWSPMFPPLAVTVATVVEAGLIVEGAFVLGVGGALSSPFVLGAPLCLLVWSAAVGNALGRSSVAHRGAAVVDQLTGLLNREALEARLAAFAHEQEFNPHPLTMIMVDVDHFKAVNDRHGHKQGDRVLAEVSYRLRHALRIFDSAYRYGGEEFLILLPRVSEGDGLGVAERIREAVASTPIDGLSLTVSCGVATYYPPTPFDREALFAAADRRLYLAKQSGRDRSCGADAERALPLAA